MTSQPPLTGPVRRRPDLSRSQEDYLKQIFLLSEGGGMVATQRLADRLDVRPASVTGMVQRLADLELVRHEPYRGVQLTDNGRRVALEMLRHHRLIETFLARVLGYGWDEVHEEAERLEHVISERFEERIAETLGNPTRDPHGDPIPDADLMMPPAPNEVHLGAMGVGSTGELIRVGIQDPGSLSTLSELGVVPGVRIAVLAHESHAVRVRVNGDRFPLPRELAGALWLKEDK